MYEFSFEICSPSMPRDPLKAMMWELARWIAIVLFHRNNPQVKLAGIVTCCSLCSLYYDDGCESCPVRISTGRGDCYETSYQKYMICDDCEKEQLARAFLSELVSAATTAFPDYNWSEYTTLDL